VDEDSYVARIEAAKADVIELGCIADELQGMTDAAASRLRMRAIALRFQLKRKVSTAIPVSWLSELGIPAVDGRALHRCGLNDYQFSNLQKKLIKRRLSLNAAPSREIAGQFVLWAAEWFRRSYDGTGQRWHALGQVLGIALEQHEWRRLTDQGMAFWKIPPFKLNGIHHRLAAIARQGGFPIAAIEADGWAARFLEALVASLAAMPPTDVDGAVTMADRLIGAVPETWRSRELLVVAAELAIEVVRLRRLAEADGVPAGALVSAWLDRHIPEWRDDLPLSVGNEAARALIDGLLRVIPLRGGHNAVRCLRWLEIGPQGRREGVELQLSGALRDASGKALTDDLSEDWSRLRLYAAGEFAQHVAGELAVADPDEEKIWRVRPSIARARFQLDPAIAITAELRGDGKRIGSVFQLAGGEPVVGQLRVYVREGEGGQNLQLRLLGTGSGGYRADVIFVDILSSWTAAPHGPDGTCSLLDQGSEEGRSIWQISGSALFTAPSGDAYLVRGGQTALARDRLWMERASANFVLADENSTLLLGKPFLRVEEGGRERNSVSGELWWRPAGTSTWKPEPAAAAPGPCEFAWRDRVTGHIRDRRDAVVLPAIFAVAATRTGDWTEVRLSGWPYSASAPSRPQHESNCWRLPAKANTLSTLRLNLSGGDGGSFEVLVPLQHQAWLESWSDGPLRRNARLSLSTINKYVARAERCELMADLVDRNGRAVPQSRASWWVDGELPLSAIRDDLAALLRPCGDIRYQVKLNFNDGNEDYWWVGEFEHELTEERGGFVANPAIADEGVRIVRRPLHDPAHEEDCGAFSLVDSIQHRPLILPRQQGTALVYLRSGERVLSAPKPVESVLEPHAQTPLGRAMTQSNWHERSLSLERLALDACSEPNTEPSRQFVRGLIDLAMSLEGLPPSTFDALLLLSGHPGLAPMLLFQARSDEIEQVMRLVEGLPFAWWLIPRVHWEAAAKDRFDSLLAIIPDQITSVGEDVVLRMREIEQIEPVLAPLLGLAKNIPSLEDAVMAFFQRSHDRIDDSVTNPFRPTLDKLLPRWKVENERYWRAFDAPVVAALAASGRIILDLPELTGVKDVARRHPRWFREGFAAALKEF
jgi:hypothetical protein